MEICKAIIHENKRKGEQCKFPAKIEGYCERHQRNKIYDDGINEGKRWCRFFFRGCDETVKDKSLSCETHKKNKSILCVHDGCKYTVKIKGELCGNHQKDKYYKEEKEKGIKYCDIARSCLNILKDKKSCESCLEKNRIADNKRYNDRKKLSSEASKTNSDKRTCVTCSKEFVAFLTKYSKESVNCRDCSEKQLVQDAKREDRIRNYKEEQFKNIDNYYNKYISDAPKRGHGDFNLNREEFTELVMDKCYYCKKQVEGETNGIDRVNNDLGYTKGNCVTACWKCNRMKHFYHPQFFIEKCKILIKQLIPTKSFYNVWSLYYTRSSYRNYNTYKKEAEERGLPFHITEQEWDWLSRSQCYLCGYQSPKGIGLDRLDNTIRKYTLENCRPCCGSCNSMKNELTLPELLEQSKIIADAWSNTDILKDIPVTKNPLKEAEIKGHVMKIEDRKHWKAEGLYYAILSDSAEPFLKQHSENYTKQEFQDLCALIKPSTKEIAIGILKKLIVKLKKRKVRENEKNTITELI